MFQVPTRAKRSQVRLKLSTPIVILFSKDFNSIVHSFCQWAAGHLRRRALWRRASVERSKCRLVGTKPVNRLWANNTFEAISLFSFFFYSACAPSASSATRLSPQGSDRHGSLCARLWTIWSRIAPAASRPWPSVGQWCILRPGAALSSMKAGRSAAVAP